MVYGCWFVWCRRQGEPDGSVPAGKFMRRGDQEHESEKARRGWGAVAVYTEACFQRI